MNKLTKKVIGIVMMMIPIVILISVSITLFIIFVINTFGNIGAIVAFILLLSLSIGAFLYTNDD